jgi:hypothetical protein
MSTTKTYTRAGILTLALVGAGLLAPSAGGARGATPRRLTRAVDTELRGEPAVVLASEVVIRGTPLMVSPTRSRGEGSAKVWACKSPDQLEQNGQEIDALSHGGQGGGMTVRQCGWVSL